MKQKLSIPDLIRRLYLDTIAGKNPGSRLYNQLTGQLSGMIIQNLRPSSPAELEEYLAETFAILITQFHRSASLANPAADQDQPHSRFSFEETLEKNEANDIRITAYVKSILRFSVSKISRNNAHISNQENSLRFRKALKELITEGKVIKTSAKTYRLSHTSGIIPLPSESLFTPGNKLRFPVLKQWILVALKKMENNEVPLSILESEVRSLSGLHYINQVSLNPYDADEPDTADATGIPVPHTSADPEDSLPDPLTDDARYIFNRLLLQLPKKPKQTIMLKTFLLYNASEENLSTEEVAKRTGLKSPQSVLNYKQSIAEKLALLLKDMRYTHAELLQLSRFLIAYIQKEVEAHD